MARQDASDLAHSLGRQAEAVCRHYLSSGRREGNYWLVGDARNTPGRSMYVRLKDTPKGPAGKWTDAATGEHGDLLDVIRESCGLIDFKDVADEARTFLSMPPPPEARQHERQNPAPHGSPEAARRLVRMSQPIHGTLVQTYLRERGITDLRGTGSLHFHPRCYYRPEEHSPTETWPAMIAAVTDLDGKITGAHRTWLDPRRRDKAPIDTPRRAMGDLLGNAVRFGTRATGENAPSHRVLVGRAEIGAAWSKRSNEGREYLGLKLDDPSFNAPIYANLFDDEDGDTFSLIWSRPSGRRGD
ncbi:DUF736 family protein [Brevundimonas albigilva]|uniref:DUF736 domain-containing protein n=1 Tax=Brevundimonas albigilva TaxID=1312364 RepID=UPI003D67D3D6